MRGRLPRTRRRAASRHATVGEAEDILSCLVRDGLLQLAESGK
ncbi:hypothetical protein [Streptomyces hokutonensis]|nr:hypothetical protein [Streptomyces hokutonensis]